jgi:hypothetical protein
VERGEIAREASPVDLLAQIERANSECVLLEEALEEFPSMIEHKFRRQLNHVVEINCILKAQNHEMRQALQSQLRFSSPRSGIAASLFLLCRSLLIFAVLTGLATLFVWTIPYRNQQEAGLLAVRNRSASIEPVPVESTAMLKLAADGISWVEVRDLATEKTLFVGTLQSGEQRSIRMRRGLRIRSGRPDLLKFQIDGGSFISFENAVNLGWRTLMPPPLKKP